MRRCLLLVLVSLIGAAPAAAQAPVVEYYHLDATGSVRAVTDQNGTVVRRHDYFPFGEEYAAVPAADPVRFTGKERDRESGLDYFGARYYASRTGRFTTVDPVWTQFAALTDPQRWNRYAYVSNRPQSRIDPDGRYEVDVHRYLTAALSRAAGMSTAKATEIAKANQDIDDSLRTNPLIALWNLDDHHFTSADLRQRMWQQFERTGSMRDLGAFLHAHQDSYSHAGYYPIPGHAFDGHAPDKTFLRPELADRMAESTYRHLQSAAGRLNGVTVRLSWRDIEAFVQRFNRARNLEDKLGILNEWVKFVEQQAGGAAGGSQ